ncbi:MAG TPA: hypothetical protein VER33_15395 [Polyangiaceae bacterium]|nr:hypothetical protein [Polyangiaceae bacterium]
MVKTRRLPRMLALVASLGVGALCGLSDTANAEQYTRTSCGGSYKDPFNFYWNNRHAVSTVSNTHIGTDSCGGHLNEDSICGTEQSFKYSATCTPTYRKPCGYRSNYRRYHARVYSNGVKEVFSHQDQGCRCVGQVCTADGARFNPGRDNQHYWVITGCRAGSKHYWGNTMSISQGCGVGNQSSDGYVSYVH